MNKAIEREFEYLEDQLANGEISEKEFSKEMREIERSYQSEAQESAEQAYRDEYSRW